MEAPASANGQHWHPAIGKSPDSKLAVLPQRKKKPAATLQPSLLWTEADEPEQKIQATVAVAPEAFRLGDVETASGLKAKGRDLIGAIRLLKTLEAEARDATADEKKILARFTGFGAVANHIFPEPGTERYKEGWQALGQELHNLLTEEEYASAKRSTFNAFYTSPAVMQAVYAALGHFGVDGDDLRVLEPGCGIGNFIGMAPEGMRFIGVELETLSGRIARKLYPQHTIRIENFKDTQLPPGSVDLVVGNVPFSDLKLSYDGTSLALHDYFFAKSLDLSRDGGILALVTSRYTLDKLDLSFRQQLSDQADFLGAIRLPSDAFSEQGTKVVTDILFLRKRGREMAEHHAANWLDTEPLVSGQEGTRLNRYFVEHPEMVAGSLTVGRGMYQNHELRVEPPAGGLAEALHAAMTRLPRDVYVQRDAPLPELVVAPPVSAVPSGRRLPPGSLLVGEQGRIMQVANASGFVEPVMHGQTPLNALTGTTGQKLAALIGLRDAARHALWTQNEERPALEREAARQRLNALYDRFVGQWGPINKTTVTSRADGGVTRRMPNVEKFRDDPDAYLVMALERYDEKTDTAEKMPILLQDVVGPTETVQQVASALDGLLVSLNERGRVDLDCISRLYGKSEQEIISELGTRIFFDPALEAYVTAEAYLSGNVREKLRRAREAAGEREMVPNIAVLEEALPEDVSPGDIDPNLGAPWIPVGVIRNFTSELLECDAEEIQVAHTGKEALWLVNASRTVTESVQAVSSFGTKDCHAIDLLNDALNLRVPTLYQTIWDGDEEKRVVDQTATLAAREKLSAIRERFRQWVFAEPDRTDDLVRRYNDIFNNVRLRSYDGSHLTFPGMNPAITLHSHQVDAIWRTMSGGNTLLAHAVGAGKTFEMIASGMKMKQTGLVRKPLYVVPNHMLEQFSREFYLLYPNANLLVASKEDMTEAHRKLLTAKVASGAWDGIILTHSSFSKIGMSPEFQRAFLQEQIGDYEALLTDMRRSASDEAEHRLIKQIEKKKAAWEERLQTLMNADDKDSGLTFEDLGVDQIFIDEAHLFKNLETATKMERVAGVQTEGSQRALDLLMKTKYLESCTPGRGVTFATGTPISNSMVEMYTMLRFLAPHLLEERGIGHFDAWAAVFGDIVDSVELSPDGQSLRTNRRFARFVNLPELLQIFHLFADVKTASMLDLPCPLLKGNAAQIVACPMSGTQRAIQEHLVERYERVRAGGLNPRIDNALNITTDGRKLALDARLVTQGAEAFEEGKIEALVEKVHAIWQRTAENRATQMIFCDLGVSDADGRFSVYQAVIRRLKERGIPANEIAAIGDYESDARKAQLFAQVRRGDVRVLLGSTSKMGTGTNVQQRLVALHHLDAPWKPAEVEQREGRILRQGNMHEEVEIYRYVTEGSFDAYMWQTLETKAGFINQVMTGDLSVRRMEDMDEQALSYAEVKAIASGNPAMLTLAKMDMEHQRLVRLERAYQDEQYQLRRTVRTLEQTDIPALKKHYAALESDLAVVGRHGGITSPDLMLNGQRVTAGEQSAKLLRQQVQRAWEDAVYRLEAAPEGTQEQRRLGSFGGIELTFTLEKGEAESWHGLLELKGTVKRKQSLRSPNSEKLVEYLQRMVDALVEAHRETGAELAKATARLVSFQEHLGQPFAHSARLTELSGMRAVLQSLLQDGAKLETICEQCRGAHWLPPVPPASETELMQALVKAFEASVQPRTMLRPPMPENYRDAHAVLPLMIREQRRDLLALAA